MGRLLQTVGLGLLLAAFAGGGGVADAATGSRLETFVSIPPQAYLVERVGGRHVGVQVLVQAGQEPHTFKPTPKQMMALGRARVYFRVGMPFETRLLEKIRGSRSDITVVDTVRGIKRVMMSEHGPHHAEAEEHAAREGDHAEHAGHEGDHPEHSGHGDVREGEDHEHEHEKGAPDPHIWLSPPLIKIQARNIADGLKAADPAHADDYEANLKAFLKDVDATHARIRKVLAPFKGEAFYVFHPAFGYFGDAYGLRQEAVEVEGKNPTPKQISALVRKARADGVHIIFVQPQFDRRSVQPVATAIDGVVVPMDPLARDVLKNLESMATQIEKALKKPVKPS